ncbi:MAG: hypothetical protein AB1714_11400 [Acidobacteriota bacterium]
MAGVLLAMFSSAGMSEAAELRCRVVNGTTGGPCSPDAFALMKLAEGMEEVESRENPGAEFSVAGLSKDAQYLLQVAYKGVRYNSTISFSGGDRQDMELSVYELGHDDSLLRLRRLSLRITLDAGWMLVDQTIEALNMDKHVYADSRNGSLRFSLPAGVGQVESVFVTSTHMPTRQDVVSLAGTPQFALDYPLKPGPTQIQMSFRAPYNGSYDYRQRFEYPVENVEIVVAPPSVVVEGAAVKPLQGPPADEVAVYGAGPISSGGDLAFILKGESMPASSGVSTEEGMQAETQSDIVEHPLALYHYKLHLILLMTCAMSLAFWFGLREPPPPPSPAPRTKKRK